LTATEFGNNRAVRRLIAPNPAASLANDLRENLGSFRALSMGVPPETAP
jgi:hypothetical protein